MKLRLI